MYSEYYQKLYRVKLSNSSERVEFPKNKLTNKTICAIEVINPTDIASGGMPGDGDGGTKNPATLADIRKCTLSLKNKQGVEFIDNTPLVNFLRSTERPEVTGIPKETLDWENSFVKINKPSALSADGVEIGILVYYK